MTQTLPEALALLARAAPQEWARFLEAYRDHYNKRVGVVIGAPPDMLPVNQGMAREAADFLKKIAEATPGVKLNA